MKKTPFGVFKKLDFEHIKFSSTLPADMERTYSYFALQFARQHKIQFANLYQFEEDFEIDAQTVVFD